MLRALLVLLLAANAFWWAATHGWLPMAWLPFPDPDAQREPQRLQQQIRPEAITVLPAKAGGNTPAAAPRTTACLEATGLPDAAARSAAEGLLRSAGIDAARWTWPDGDDGATLRVQGLASNEQEALRAAAALAAGAPAFSPCR
ncbi:MAG: hypothetical protein H6932_00605 [Burkholderiaceae bacterium]|nr:hypothetical protein [Burkholderiaceae bacterium]